MRYHGPPCSQFVYFVPCQKASVSRTVRFVESNEADDWTLQANCRGMADALFPDGKSSAELGVSALTAASVRNALLRPWITGEWGSGAA